MTEGDLRAVRRIERIAYTDAWSRRVFEQELRNAFAHYFVAEVAAAEGAARPRRGASRVVALLSGARPAPALAGFAGVWYMGDQLHIVTIAVDPRRQGQGIGARLLLECFARAIDAELRTLALEVRVSNDRARGLYERYGFSVAGRLHGYYQDDGEDALVMLTPELDTPYLRQLDLLRERHRARFPELWVAADAA